jgi:transposase
VFIDESWINCGMTCLYGWAFRSQRLNEYVPDVRFEQTTVISSVRLDGKQATLMFKGALNGEIFSAYVRDILAPTLRKGDVVVLDNLSAHKVKGALAPIYARGATVMFLPPYSPDFSPIELCWSKMKSIVRKLKPRSYEELIFVLKIALESITRPNVKNWFKHCGYMAQ